MSAKKMRLPSLWPINLIRDWRDGQIVRFNRRLGYIPISETSAQDVFICGYPKSGNTWVQTLLASLIFGLEPCYLTDHLVQAIVSDVHQAMFYKRFFEPCFFKTHHNPRPEYRRVVHLVRDPRDVAVSFHHMDKARGRNLDLGARVELVIDGWRRHAEEYIENRYGANMINLRYEDLLEQPETEVIQLMEFSGLERSRDICLRAIEGNRFSKIKRREVKFGIANPNWPANQAFFRKGTAGSFSDTLSARHVARIEKQLDDLMRHFGYEPST